jgi:hypothetical protein
VDGGDYIVMINGLPPGGKSWIQAVDGRFNLPLTTLGSFFEGRRTRTEGVKSWRRPKDTTAFLLMPYNIPICPHAFSTLSDFAPPSTANATINPSVDSPNC